MNSKTPIEEIRHQFYKHRNSDKAEQMKAYMKGLFPFYGIQQAERKRLSSDWIKEVKKLSHEEKWSVIFDLWNESEREMQYLALDILRSMEARFTQKDITHIEKLVLEKSWWDTVDALAARACGGWLRTYPEKKEMVITRWRDSGELWLIRCSLLFQMFYKEQTDEDLLFSLCDQFCKDKEFFIRKGIGWALRQYAKTQPEQVCAYVKSNPHLSGLSKREALKHIKNQCN
jgi:3-methyladenine DNA glycosylase AlkD